MPRQEMMGLEHLAVPIERGRMVNGLLCLALGMIYLAGNAM